VSTSSERPVLYVIACGGSPAGGLPGFVAQTQGLGWDVCVIATPSGLKFIDAAELAGLTGHPVRSEYKQPDEPDVLPPADAFVVAPATFNTVISDTQTSFQDGRTIPAACCFRGRRWSRRSGS
jgi:hypothetical protein